MGKKYNIILLYSTEIHFSIRSQKKKNHLVSRHLFHGEKHIILLISRKSRVNGYTVVQGLHVVFRISMSKTYLIVYLYYIPTRNILL